MSRDLDFVRNLDAWPNYPILPVVHKTNRSAGFLWAGAGPIVYIANIWGLDSGTYKSITENLPKQEYNDFEQLLAEWRVD